VPPIRSWCDENIYISSEETSIPQQYDGSLTPYLDELYKIMHPDHPVQQAGVMKGTQLAFTTLAKNCIAHRIVNDPCSFLYVLPTLVLARKFSKQRIKTMIEHTDALNALIDTSKSRDSDNAWDYKGFPGGVLMIGAANSAASLSQSPVQFLVLDENDRFPRDVDNEGDPSTIAMGRLDGAGDMQKMLRISSPTAKGFSHIESDLLQSDYRKYFVPCPSCNFFHTFEWDNFVIPRGEDNRFITKESYFTCPKCAAEIQEKKHKTSMLADGDWKPTKPENIKETKRGYHLSSFYSPVGMYSWEKFADAFADATGPEGTVHKLRAFTNTKRAETFKQVGATVNHKTLKNRMMDWGDKLPDDTCILTCGVDVQDNRLELEIVAWNQYEDSYSIKYHVIPGSPGNQSTWDKLDLILFHGLNRNQRTWKHALSPKVSLPILATCIDMGGHYTQAVLNYCASRVGLNVWAINGKGGQGRPVWPRKISTGKHKLPFYTIGVDTAKETIYNRLKLETINTGCCWFPKDRDKEYFRGLTSEEVVEDATKSGIPNRRWQIKTGFKRNEPLDLRVYAYAALEGLKLHGLVLAAGYTKIIERAGRG